MKTNLIAEASITIDAISAKVWEAITTPELIKKYLFGTNVTSDWKEGSTITYQGEFNGVKYHDKGIIIKFEPEKIFQSTYWSSMSGKEDRPENYNLVTYTLEELGDQTVLTITQDNNATEEAKNHSTENWKMVLAKLKEVVESN